MEPSLKVMLPPVSAVPDTVTVRTPSAKLNGSAAPEDAAPAPAVGRTDTAAQTASVEIEFNVEK